MNENHNIHLFGIQSEPDIDEDDAIGNQRQSKRLIALAEEARLFHTADCEPWATVPVESHRENYPLGSNAFRRWLVGKFYKDTQRAPSPQAYQKAIAVLEARAIYDRPQLLIGLRCAEQNGKIYVDIADQEWNLVEIDSAGWKVVQDAPVRFRRADGMRPLPMPQRNGDLEQLRRFVNVKSEADWKLLVCFLLAALRPGGPFPILVLCGEQGSAKSTTSRVLRKLVDPNSADLRSTPKDERDLMIAAGNSWILAFDNLSRLSQAHSDALCRLATGGGFATRKLYTDREEVIIDVQRPIILNGIEEIATRGDLLDRSIVLEPPPIAASGRQSEAEFWADFEAARPKILGALFDSVSAALAILPSIELPMAPRMADFAKWAVAVEKALEWLAGSFLSAYEENRAVANEIAMESFLIAEPLGRVSDFQGTAQQLMLLLDRIASGGVTRQPAWPKTARAFAGELRRLAPNLRQQGIQVRFRRSGGKRLIFIAREMQLQALPAQPAQMPSAEDVA